MMKNQNFVNSSMVSLEPWRVFFLEILFIPPKRTKPLRLNRFVIKNQNRCDSYLLGNFVLYIPHRTKPGFELRNCMLKSLQVL